jgi:hypothetical protein
MAIGKAETLKRVAVVALMSPNIPVFHKPTFKAIFMPAASPYPAAPMPVGVAELSKGSKSSPICYKHVSIRGQ